MLLWCAAACILKAIFFFWNYWRWLTTNTSCCFHFASWIQNDAGCKIRKNLAYTMSLTCCWLFFCWLPPCPSSFPVSFSLRSPAGFWMEMRWWSALSVLRFLERRCEAFGSGDNSRRNWHASASPGCGGREEHGSTAFVRAIYQDNNLFSWIKCNAINFL